MAKHKVKLSETQIKTLQLLFKAHQRDKKKKQNPYTPEFKRLQMLHILQGLKF
jgi:hypothetical protein